MAVERCNICGRVLNVDGTCQSEIEKTGKHKIENGTVSNEAEN